MSCEGFDEFTGRRWIYPNNLAVRPYQKQAVHLALFNNAMIVLPTGFGKTFIAAVVMYNFYRWYPEGKIIFVAPTRPLVAQQIEECKKISGIPSKDCVELTGTIGQSRRHELWHTKRVFFATPQVIQNDLQSDLLEPKFVKCLVIDEAHKAQGNYAYVEIVKQLQKDNPDGFRVLALSATPGSNIERVKQVMINLFINEVMFRQENALDLMSFKNTKISKAWTVNLSGKHKKFVDIFVSIANPIFKELHRAGLTFSCDTIERASRYVLLMAKQRLQRNEVANVGARKGKLMFYCTSAMSLVHAFEILTVYGIRPFYNHVKRAFEEKSCLKTALFGNTEFTAIMNDMEAMFGVDLAIESNKTPTQDLLQSHPKLRVVKDLLFKHFEVNKDKQETRAIVFTKYRDSVLDIVQTLRLYDPVIKPCAFVGQGSGPKGSASKASGGMKQREQIAAIQEFKDGLHNVLVATCVAEEGLDIGEVDLIICYDTSVSPISNTQRRGRTGRKRSGDVHTLLTAGYEEKKLSKASNSRRTVEDQLYNRDMYMMCRYHKAPRMVPIGINPECFEQKIYPIQDDEDEEESQSKRKRKRPSIQTNGSAKKKSKCKEVDESWSDLDDLKQKQTNSSPSTQGQSLPTSSSPFHEDEDEEQQQQQQQQQDEDWSSDLSPIATGDWPGDESPPPAEDWPEDASSSL